MKKMIVWLLMVLLLLGGCVQKTSAVQEPVVDTTNVDVVLQTDQGIEAFAVDGYEDFLALLTATLIDGKENKNLSPISVYVALAMAAEGAQGKTQAELLALLGEKNLESLRKKVEQMLKTLTVSLPYSELVLANSLWMGEQDEEVSFRDAYVNTLGTSYGAEALSVRFGQPEAGERIAAWIREKTRDKIQISEDAMTFDATTLAVLINTIYLKDGWRNPFKSERTENGVFYGLNGQEQQVTYMRQTDYSGTIVRGDGYIKYIMPLNAVGNMVFILPDEGVSLESLLGSADKIENLLTGGEQITAMVDVMMPKFGFQDRTDLEEALLSLGVQTCFTEDADFSGITDAAVHISRVLQESRIDVNEDGVEAAAYTLIAMEKNAFMPLDRESVEFYLTRPFLYTIEGSDGTVLFIGTVTAPTEA